MKESHKNMIGFSSMHVHVCVKLESKYIDTHKLVAGVTGHVFTTLKVLLSNYRSRYEGGGGFHSCIPLPYPGFSHSIYAS